MASAGDIIDRWAEYHKGTATRLLRTRSGNVYVDSSDVRNVLSYGQHFILARYMEAGWFLLNGDSYSPTTSGHQSTTRSALSGEECLIVPFSALDAAGIDYDSIVRVDVKDDRNIQTEHKSRNREDMPEYKRSGAQPDLDGYYHWTTFEHFLGASVFTAETVERKWERTTEDQATSHRNFGTSEFVPIHEWEERRRAHYLSGFDQNETRSLYFLCELPEPVDTYEGALEVLKPPSVQKADMIDIPYTRQGDIFAVECPNITKRELRSMGAKFGKRTGLSAFEYMPGFDDSPTDSVIVDAFGGVWIPNDGRFDDSLATRKHRDTGEGWGRIGELPDYKAQKDAHMELSQELVRNARLLETNHVASETAIMPDNSVYARGCLYHDPGDFRPRDHARRKMGNGKTWHLIEKNTVPASYDTSGLDRTFRTRAWTLGGRVD